MPNGEVFLAQEEDGSPSNIDGSEATGTRGCGTPLFGMIGRLDGHVRYAAGTRSVGVFEEACLVRLSVMIGRAQGRMRALWCVGLPYGPVVRS